MWLTALSAGLEKQQLKNLLEKIESFDSKLDRELADSVLEVTVNADWEIVEELRGDERMCQALLEIMEPEINKIKEEAASRERQKGIMGTVIALHDCSQGNKEIKKAIIKVHDISAKEAEEYL